MARPLRLESRNGIYHVINRGNYANYDRIARDEAVVHRFSIADVIPNGFRGPS